MAKEGWMNLKVPFDEIDYGRRVKANTRHTTQSLFNSHRVFVLFR